MSDQSSTTGDGLLAAAQRLRRSARIVPTPAGLVIVINHTDWVAYCDALDGISAREHNTQRGHYYAGRRRAAHPERKPLGEES